MKQVMYSIYDKLVGFGQPFFVPLEGFPDENAMRLIKTSLAGIPDIERNNKIEHLQLCRLGTFDSEFGKIDTPDMPDTVCDCADLFIEVEHE